MYFEKKLLHRSKQDFFFVLDIYVTAKTIGFKCGIKKAKAKRNTHISLVAWDKELNMASHIWNISKSDRGLLSTAVQLISYSSPKWGTDNVYCSSAMSCNIVQMLAEIKVFHNAHSYCLFHWEPFSHNLWQTAGLMKKEGLEKQAEHVGQFIVVDSTAAWVCSERYGPLVVVRPQFVSAC